MHGISTSVLISMSRKYYRLTLACTMILEQIKGFYHGITKILLLVGSYTMLSWHLLNVYIVVHVRIDCGI